MDNLSELLGEIALLAKNLNSKDGTIGKLIHDDKLYRELAGVVSKASTAVGQATGAITDVRGLINDRQLNWRVRQIIDNVAAFAQKIAQDPGRIARGVLPRNRELPIK